MNNWEENIEQYIRESNLIEGIDDNTENINSLYAWDWLTEQEDINGETICELQGAITRYNDWLPPEAKGAWRTCGVRVGYHIAPRPEKVQQLMQDYVMDFYSMDPIEAHVEFERIHPFVDGNGRTGRMLYWWHCKQLGIIPIFFTADARYSYYQLFKTEEEKIEEIERVSKQWMNHNQTNE